MEEEGKPDRVTRVISLSYASARDLVYRLSPAPQNVAEVAAKLKNDRQEFLRRAIADAVTGVRPIPEVMAEPGLYPFSARPYAEAQLAQAVHDAGDLSGLLPKGLSAPPTAIPDQNALLVRGTPQAVDEFAELIRLLDVTPRQVSISVKLLNIAEQLDQEHGEDLSARVDDFVLFLWGPAPTGPLIRIVRENTDLLLAGRRSAAVSNTTAGAHVTATNNTPCMVRAATIIPVVLVSLTFDQWGNGRVDYTVDAVATGVELFVLPRINNDDTVTMHLRPTFIDAIGQVVGPDGRVAPITSEVVTETVVRVGDGQTAVLGGFPRTSQALEATGFPINFRQSRTIHDIQSLLFVTPRIVRLLEPKVP